MEDWRLGRWTPAEHRFLGLDRRYLTPLALVVGVWLLWSVVLPAIDDGISRSEVRAGDVVRIAHGVEYAPAADWIYAGVPAPGAPDSAVYTQGVTFSIHSGLFGGSPRALLAQAGRHGESLQLTGATRTVVLGDGLVGAARAVQEDAAAGGLFAFVRNGVGVVVKVAGPSALVSRQTGDVARMVSSIRLPAAGTS